MKRSLLLLVLTALMVVSFSGCGSTDSGTESVHEVPQETCLSIRQELYEYFHGFDDNSEVSVFGYNGALVIDLTYEGMVLRVPFPDYVNALIVQSKELAAKYGEDIYEIGVRFTGGQEKSLIWVSYDGISGNLTDTYEDTIFLPDQTVQDLVDRYGCMDWFYQLSEPETSPQPDVPEDVSDSDDVQESLYSFLEANLEYDISNLYAIKKGDGYLVVIYVMGDSDVLQKLCIDSVELIEAYAEENGFSVSLINPIVNSENGNYFGWTTDGTLYSNAKNPVAEDVSVENIDAELNDFLNSVTSEQAEYGVSAVGY